MVFEPLFGKSQLRKRPQLSLFFVLAMSVPVIAGQEITVSAIQKVSLAGDDIIQVKANAQAGFNFPFYLFVPKAIDKHQKIYLLVEPNNTGKTSDELHVHQESALRLVSKNYPNKMARRMGTALLVPVFPRPRTNWQAYTHALDRDTLEIEEGKLKRIDLQLTAMIKYAQQLLRINGFKIDDRVYMHGFSASAKFSNRYSFLHPEMVKAFAVGGVNGLPTLPVSEWNGCELPFPIGIAGIERFIDKPFDEKAFRQVAHYIYMGAFDRNDTLPSRDAWSEEEADIIKKALAETMMPDRWELSQKIYKDQDINAQCVTYNGVSHSIKDEMLNDVIKFFKAHYGEKYNPIEPHQYPFVEYKQIKHAHINGLYWFDDERVPKWIKKNPKQQTFLIGIEEWIEGQDHTQLVEFYENAGFNFVLKAEGQKDIKISAKSYPGTSSQGDGEFQVFYARLNDSQFGQIVPGVPYRLEPLNKSNEYFWTVNDGVTLTKEDGSRTFDALNSTMLPNTIRVDGDIRAVIALLEHATSEIELPGQMKKVEFILAVEPEELTQLPKIKFSAEGLSVIEVLWIACNRASLEYRISGNKVYIDKKR
jgi:hypothetical protein